MPVASIPVKSSPLASFLRPEGFARPHLAAVLREGSVVAELSRYALRTASERRTRSATPYAARFNERESTPILLVPGFLAGDNSLSPLAGALRRAGFRTYSSRISSNIACTADTTALLEARLESIALRRGSRVQIVGHSLGGMLARGLAVRRPDLVSGIVTLGSPMLAPGAHHHTLSASVGVLVRLSRAGVPGLMSEDCVAGLCARQSFDESQQAVPAEVAFTAFYSKRDGIVDWRACIDPAAAAVEVTTSHIGMVLDPHVIDQVTAVLRRSAEDSALEVDCGESA